MRKIDFDTMSRAIKNSEIGGLIEKAL
jgi:hypothetical protein